MTFAAFAAPFKETKKERIARLRQHFMSVSWPVPWTAEVEEKSNVFGQGVAIRFAYPDKDWHAGHLSLSFERKSAFIDSFDIDPEEQGNGIGRTLAAFVFDELAGQGVTKTQLLAIWDGGYMWPRLGARSRDWVSLPHRSLGNLMNTVLRIRQNRRAAFIKKCAAIVFSPAKAADKVWRLSDIDERLPDGKKAGHAILGNTVCRHQFDALNPKCVERLKAYAPGHRFKYL